MSLSSKINFNHTSKIPCHYGSLSLTKTVLWGSVCLLVLSASLLAAVHSNGFSVNEDAFISFRYAKNLAAGHGLRFNLDGAPTEGYSNFLLVLILAGAYKLGLNIIQCSVVIGVVSLMFTVLCLLWAIRKNIGLAGLWAPVAFALSTLAIQSSVNGMETALYGLLLFAGVVLFIHGFESPRTGIVPLAASGAFLGLASLTRPEGPLFLVALSIPRAISLWREARKNHRIRLRSDLVWVGSFCALYVPYFLWRIHYFGYLFPNTYYAKGLGFTNETAKLLSGAKYLVLNCMSEPLFPIALILGSVFHMLYPSTRLRLLLWPIFAQAIFLVLAGGDWPHMFGHGRHLYPIYPLCLWLLAETLVLLWKFSSRAVVGAIVTSLLVLSCVNLTQQSRLNLPDHYIVKSSNSSMYQALYRTYISDLKSIGTASLNHNILNHFSSERFLKNFDGIAGRWLKNHYGPNTRIAAIQAGQFAYWSELPMFDMFGLVTSEVAHSEDLNHESMVNHIQRFDPHLIAFYKHGSRVHNGKLVRTGFLQSLGFGFRYWIYGPQGFSFVVFEKGYQNPLDPNLILFSPLQDLKEIVPPSKRIFLNNRAR